MTHYIPAFTQRVGRNQRAFCGSLVPATVHSNEPSCPECAAALTQDATDLAALEAMPPASNPVTYEPFDPCAGYRAKR